MVSTFSPRAGQLAHLARRFFGSLNPAGPPDDDRRWALERLSRPEQEIWLAMSGPDRRHSVAVARAVGIQVRTDIARDDLEPDWAALFSDDDDLVRTAEAAGLLHDSGKNVSGLSTPLRVAATVIWAFAPGWMLEAWSNRQGLRRRLALYRRHPELGSRALQGAESHPLVHRWAAQHHDRPDEWTVPAPLATILKVCDDD